VMPAQHYTQPAPAAVQPMPQAQEPVAKSRSYITFFNFDRADLTPDAQEIVQTVVNDTQKGYVARVEVTGHADRAGTRPYNDGLSRRRAEAVKQELIARGIKAD